MTEVAQNQGRVVANAIMMTDFVKKKDAIIFGASAPPGEVKWLGTIIGRATDMKEKMTAQPDGGSIRSVEFGGFFEKTVYETGELGSARAVYLPRAFTAELEMGLAESKKADPTATIDFAVEIGLEATGRTIPYTYRVRAFHQQTVDPLAHLRQLLPGGGGQNVLTTDVKQDALRLEGGAAVPVATEDEPETEKQPEPETNKGSGKKSAA